MEPDDKLELEDELLLLLLLLDELEPDPSFEHAAPTQVDCVSWQALLQILFQHTALRLGTILPEASLKGAWAGASQEQSLHQRPCRLGHTSTS